MNINLHQSPSSDLLLNEKAEVDKLNERIANVFASMSV